MKKWNKINYVYNGLNLTRLYGKGDLLKKFGQIGVRKYGKFKSYSDFFVYFHMTLWEWVYKEVIENNSIAIFGNLKIMLKPYPIKLHLSPDLISNDFKLIVPLVKIGKGTRLIWSPFSVIKQINTPGAFSEANPRVLRQADVKEYLQERFKDIPVKKLNSIISLCVTLMKRLIRARMNPTIRYKNYLCVIGDFDMCFKQVEKNGKNQYGFESFRERKLKELIDYVKRNFS